MMFHFSVTRKKGFTLIELLIVLVLIGLSSAFVIPSMWKQLSQIQYRSEIAKIRTLANYCRNYSFYKGTMLKVTANDSYLTITNSENGIILRVLEFETVSFERNILYFDKISIFSINKLKFIRKGRSELLDIEI